MTTKTNTKTNTKAAAKTIAKTTAIKAPVTPKVETNLLSLEYNDKIWEDKLDSGFSNAALNVVGPQVCEFHTTIVWLANNKKTLISPKGKELSVETFKERKGALFIAYKKIYLDILGKLSTGVSIEEINKEYKSEGTQIISFLSWLKAKGYSIK